MKHGVHLLALPALAFAAVALAQTGMPAALPTGWQVTGIPALNFDADEGFGYGLIGQAYDYGGGAAPYRYTIQPTIFLTTKGRRDATVFFDAPHLLPDGWRLSVYTGRLQELATPYYGLGNDSPYDPNAEKAPNPYYYRFGREGFQFAADVQHVIAPSLRLLAGGGTRTSTIAIIPFDSGATLLASETNGNAIPRGRTTYGRLGLVWDTRDNEIATRSGAWIEGLAQHAGGVLGGTTRFTRATVTARWYVSPTARLTFAERLIGQNVWGSPPFYELSDIQSSFQDADGLGGSSSVRGLPKDRYIGRGLMLLNNEARLRAADFPLLGRPSSLVLSGFVDAGRVWEDQLDLAQITEGIHAGVGGGAHLTFGPSFVVTLDVGHSSQSTAPIYIGLGYAY